MREARIDLLEVEDISTAWGARLAVTILRGGFSPHGPRTAELDTREVAELRDVCNEFLAERGPA